MSFNSDPAGEMAAETISHYHLAAGSQAEGAEGECGAVEYPFANGGLSGVKCCTKCGTTKTPQWREGPYGAKSLCNACGVKRTRKLRAEQEGAKRRRLSASPPAPSPLKAALPPKMGKASLHITDALDSFGSLEPESEAFYVAPSAGQAQGRRPSRRAAEEAAARTARYARTGQWAQAEGGEQEEDEEHAPRALPVRTSSSDSLPSSDCPEEVSWSPRAGGALAAPGLLPPPAQLDTYAAVNLLTMSANCRRGAAPAGAAQHPHEGVGSPAVSWGQSLPRAVVEQFNHDSLVALACAGDKRGAPLHPAAHPHRVLPVELPELADCLPKGKVEELLRLNRELDLHVREAHAADSAVAAVAHILADRQACALRSREAAVAATKRLRRYMVELDTQFGIQARLGQAAAAAAPARARPLPPVAL